MFWSVDSLFHLGCWMSFSDFGLVLFFGFVAVFGHPVFRALIC